MPKIRTIESKRIPVYYKKTKVRKQDTRLVARFSLQNVRSREILARSSKAFGSCSSSLHRKLENLLNFLSSDQEKSPPKPWNETCPVKVLKDVTNVSDQIVKTIIIL